MADESVIPGFLERREIGRVTGTLPGATAGPTLIVVGAIHGNEQAGIHASRRVLELLSRNDVTLRGELLAIAGNLGAARLGRRYQLRDLNRVWHEEQVAALESKVARGEALDFEEQEQHDILVCVRDAIARARGPVYLVDLHTTSADGVAFGLFGDTLSQRAFVGGLPLPMVMGLEEALDGVLSSYWTRQGCVTFAVEGGQHDDPGSIDNLAAVLLLAAETAGVFARGPLNKETQAAFDLLETRRGSLPRIMEVVSRHAITDDDAFTMEPGFRNLDHARAMQLLARDRKGEIRAPRDGLVMLPLYQAQGSDGFFWGRPVSRTRMRASGALRHLRLDRLLDKLPGVARDKQRPSRLVVDRALADLYPVGVFHLLGYRRIRRDATGMTLERQPD